ncbi:MAG: phosphoribosylglycinamide formyltransferase [Candidatus Sumerlaeaceae bacterium]|nr:phosphoribosylglycinamide formyltransferase [Candidatus Sumerlaeaceae bacterium]
MSKTPVHIGLLISGRGSNLGAILKNQEAGAFSNARVAVVFSNNPGAPGLEIARQHGIPALSANPADFADKKLYENHIVALFRDHQVSLVALAGYMKIVGKTLLSAFPNRIVNIHPSLLPAFPGLNAANQAIEHGVKISGCTVHLVDDGVDTGPIIAQRAVPVLPGDNEETLSARILEREHEVYSETLKRLTEAKWEVRGRHLFFLSDLPEKISG